jgi:hypothetical protein
MFLLFRNRADQSYVLAAMFSMSHIFENHKLSINWINAYATELQVKSK